jgi:hypothetical protein
MPLNLSPVVGHDGVLVLVAVLFGADVGYLPPSDLVGDERSVPGVAVWVFPRDEEPVGGGGADANVAGLARRGRRFGPKLKCVKSLTRQPI